MDHSDKTFRHESLQDSESIQDLLQSLCKGLARGKLKFSDEDGDIVLAPRGLLNFRLSATADESEDRVSIKISWQRDGKHRKERKLKIASK